MALEISHFCKQNKIKFIFRIASDWDLGAENLTDADLKNWCGLDSNQIETLLKNSDVVFVQTPYQLNLLERKFNVKGQVLMNPINIKYEEVDSSPKKFDGLWIGKSSSVKRPELFVKLAQQNPDRTFCMVFNKHEPNIWSTIVSLLPKNVSLVESVPLNEIENYFKQSRILINTSKTEGLANTFLQAAKFGLPIISMCSNPNEMFTKFNLGILTDDNLEKTSIHFNKLLDEEKLYKQSSSAGKEFVKEYHDSNKIVNQFYETLKLVVNE
jgi:glycosyltransferase involved in cell wall biosynthesis